MSPVTRPRIRSIKPELWKNEEVGALSLEARLTFIGLITMADDAGRIRLTATSILGHVFPFNDEITAARLRKWIGEIKHQGLCEVYEAEGRTYLWLTGWQHNQKITRPSPSNHPCPPNPAGTWAPHDGQIQ
jgi:hypothetical protein